MRFHIVGRHKWVAGAVITESVAEDNRIRRFTATIRGYQNWKIWQGESGPDVLAYVMFTVRTIRDRIDDGGEAVFTEANEYVSTMPWKQACADYLEALVAETF